MLSLIGLAALAAGVYFVYEWYLKQKAAAAALLAPVEATAVEVETKVQTDVATAEKVADTVVSDIKAKL